MRFYRSHGYMPLLIVALTAGLIGAGPVAYAATVLWDGGAGTDMNWTTDGPGGNWSGSAMPALSDTAAFTHVAGGAAHGALTNVVPGSYTVHTLSYQLDTTTPTAFFHTTEIVAGQTLLATGGLNVSPFGVPGQSYSTFMVDVVVTGGTSTLQVGNTGTNTANIVIGRTISGSSHSNGKLDLSGLGTFVANANLLSLGQGYDWGNIGVAEVKLAASNLISATTIETGRGTGSAKIFLGQNNVIRADTFHLNIGKGSAGSEVRFQSGLVNPVLNLSGLNNAGVDLAVSYNRTTNTGGTITDVIDLSGGTFNATIAELTLGRYNYSLAGGSRGTLIMDAGTVTANTIAMAITTGTNPGNTQGTLTMRGGSFTVSGAVTDGRGTSTINVHNGAMNVAGDFAVDNVWVGANDGTAVLNVGGAVAIGSGAGSTLDVAVVAAGGTGGGSGTLNFANATSVAIDVDTVRIANSGHGAGSTGLVQLSGGANTIRADEIVIGNRKGAATVNMAAGGSLDIQGQSGARANLSIGRNNINTGGTPLATLDATAGVFTAQLDQLLLGHKSGGSAAGSGRGEVLLGSSAANNVNVNNVVIAELSDGGTATGRLQMRGGTFTVNGAITDGGGTSTIQLDGGTMTVGSGLEVDHLRVGYGGLSASLTVSGGPVVIGTGSEVFDIGNRDTVSGGTTSGTADFSAAASVNINVNRLGIAQIPGTGGTTSGTLILPATGPATIRANVISVADIPSASGSGLGIMHLGAGTTDIAVDHFYLGYRKKDAELDILPGGVLNIQGRLGAAANLYVGYNAVNTGSVPESTMDLTGGTLNAVLNNMTVGYHTSIPTSAGSGTGELTFEAGTISATTVVVGGGGSTGRGIGTINMNGGSFTADSITLGTGNANTSGTFNLAGGTLSAGSIVQGTAGSTANFHWTDGRLHVDQFGSSALALDLLQQDGTLAPGNSIGTTEVFGDYTQLAAGVLEIEIAGPANHDFVMVHRDASLYGTVHVLMDGYEAQLRESFDVLQTTGDLTLGSLGSIDITGDLPNSTFGWWAAAAVPGPGGEGAFLRLTVVPEPASALLALLAIAALLGRRPRR